MFFLITGLIFLVPSYLYWRKHRGQREQRSYGSAVMTDANIAGWWALSLSVVWIFFTVILLNAVVYVMQVQDLEKITQYEANKVVYETRATDLTERLSVLLETEYPEHEREVFENLTPDNAELVFVVYPQLRAIEGFTKLASQIKSLRDRIYAQDVAIEDKRRAIRVRNRNPFYLTWILPD